MVSIGRESRESIYSVKNGNNTSTILSYELYVFNIVTAVYIVFRKGETRILI